MAELDPRPVVVVGAGMAGLAAARQLARQGCPVTLLEARQRLGGRIWTDRELGFPVELGASWIHGSGNNPLTPVARELGLEMVATDMEHPALWAAGMGRVPDTGQAMEQLLRLFERIPEVVGEEDIPLSEALAKVALLPPVDTPLRGEGMRRARSAHVADLADLSARGDSGMGPTPEGPDLVFPGGYDRFLELLIQGLGGIDLRFGTVVNGVTRTSKGLSLHTSQGELECQRLVLTLPLGVLRQLPIEPDLSPEHRWGMSQLAITHMNRLALYFQSAFWPGGIDCHNIISQAEGAFPALLDITPVVGQPVLLTFTSGRFARDMESQGEKATVKEALRALRSVFGRDLPPLLGHRLSGWGQDPYSLGSFTIFPPGADGGAYEALARPWGPVFFAGEATCRPYPGTVHGAYLSGIRAAQEVLSSL